MICPKCGSLNNDKAKFCSKCGAPLEVNENPVQPQQESFFNQNKILIICIAIVVVVAAAVGVFAYSMSQVPLEKHDFGAFSMSVPVGSDFVEDFNSIDFPWGFVTYNNKGDHIRDASGFVISSDPYPSTTDLFKYDSKDGDLIIYKSTDGNNGYIVFKEVGGYKFGIVGFNLDLLKKMANSIEVSGTISGGTTAPTPSSSSTPQSGPLKIISGSFSTGSGESDKTYAKIYVGPEHAGEQVYVQIFYSRDGSSLNNGNMVPVTVDSNGYISVASADAYHFYPDHATIKLYDANQNLKDQREVNLSPSSGTQTF